MKINVREHRRGNQKWTILQSSETHNIGHTIQNPPKKPNTGCAGHHYLQINTNNKIPTKKF